ncbi:MAG: SDR family oxidoreductase [Croceitalea sp.]|nr:SDR family oxidoreductase [Croceitalea sp.]NNM19454.1 SDR family oxidoreductase [Croceitalea sp.]
MKILVIGASGATGKHIIKQALLQNHKITALARKPNKIKFKHPNLTVVQGDVLKPKTLKLAIDGQDAVLSALGHKKFIIKTTILSRGTKNIIEAMQNASVKRLICITSLGINDSRFKMGIYYTLFVIPFILLFYFLDKEKQERLIEASQLDWTIIRPAQLTNGNLRTNYKHGEKLGHYLLTKLVSRSSVAHFMLRELKEGYYMHQKPALSF